MIESVVIRWRLGFKTLSYCYTVTSGVSCTKWVNLKYLCRLHFIWYYFSPRQPCKIQSQPVLHLLHQWADIQSAIWQWQPHWIFWLWHTDSKCCYGIPWELIIIKTLLPEIFSEQLLAGTQVVDFSWLFWQTQNIEPQSVICQKLTNNKFQWKSIEYQTVLIASPNILPAIKYHCVPILKYHILLWFFTKNCLWGLFS